jgi:hypothetical protein
MVISRSIPLGRTLDFLQEDIDMMQKELYKWREESDQHCKALKRQQMLATKSFYFSAIQIHMHNKWVCIFKRSKFSIGTIQSGIVRSN